MDHNGWKLYRWLAQLKDFSPTQLVENNFNSLPNRTSQTSHVSSRFRALGTGGQNIYLRGLFLQHKFGSPLHDYQSRIKIYRQGDRTLGPLPMLSRTIGAAYNIATFNRGILAVILI
jgi:hypothetical protein